VQRDPALFEDPEGFHPARWTGGDAQRLPRFAYFPFGGGPRICIGNRFAMMETTLILAVLAQRFFFATTPETRLDLLPTVTLRPRVPLRLRIAARGAIATVP
jgi:cytochrome P450